MIISEFAKYIQKHNNLLLTNKITPVELIQPWLKSIITKNPQTNTEKIIHTEILYAENIQGDYTFIGKSESGRTLLNALIEFGKSYENYNRAKWMEITEKALNLKHK